MEGNAVENLTITINVKPPTVNNQKTNNTNNNNNNQQNSPNPTNNDDSPTPINTGNLQINNTEQTTDEGTTPVQESPEENTKIPLWIIILFLSGGILLVAGIGIGIHQYGHKNSTSGVPEEQIEEQTITLPPRKVEQTSQQEEQQYPRPQQRGKIVLETYTEQQKTGNTVSSLKSQVSNPKSDISSPASTIPLASLRKRALVEKLFKKEDTKNKTIKESSPNVETLKKFINNSIKLGYRPREIARALIDKGWQLSDIQQSFEELELKM